MNNKETLKNYNNKLIKNNDDLQTVIDMINDLPEAGEGGTPEVKPRYIYLIKDGVEQVGNTGGYTLASIYGGTGINKVFQGDGFLGVVAYIWSMWTMTFANKFDLTEYPRLYIEYAYPKTTTPYARANVEFGVYRVDTKQVYTLINKTGVKDRTIDVLDFSQDGAVEQLQVRFGNSFDSGNNYTEYPIQIFNLYLENPNANVQDKIVEINENGTTIVSPDEGYVALNSVEINVEVESNLQDKTVEITKNSVTTVTADEGFDGLNSVIINAEVGYITTEDGVDFTNKSKTYISVVQNGATNSYSGWYTYDYIDITDVIEVEYANTPCYDSNGVYVYGISFYNANKQYISGIGFNEAENTEYNTVLAGYIMSGTTATPAGAKYMRCSTTTHTNGTFVPQITLVKKVIDIPSTEYNRLDIIYNGIENTNLTGGHTYTSVGGDGYNYKEIQNNGYITLTAKQWNRCWWQTTDKINFKPFKTCKICVEYSADKYSDSDASVYEWGVILCQSGTVLKLDHKPIVDGVGTFTRNVCEIDITDILPTLHEEYFVLQVANLTAQNSYEKYGVNFYNVWLEGEIETENAIVNITENGTTLITPSEGYRALNSVEIVTNVPNDLGEKYILETGYPTSGSVQNQPTNVYIKGFRTIPAYMFGNPESTAAYKRGDRITNVVIDGDTDEIELRAFYQCSRLVNINLPDTITKIQGSAFTTCKKMLLDKLPPNLTTLDGNDTFNYCQAITIKTIPDSVTGTIGSKCFANCTALTQMSMNNVTAMLGSSSYNGVFFNCTGLKAVWIGAKITSIGSYVFQACSSLTNIYIDLPRATVEAMTGYDKAWSYISNSEGQTLTTDIIVCNDDPDFMTKEEFDAIDWTAHSE